MDGREKIRKGSLGDCAMARCGRSELFEVILSWVPRNATCWTLPSILMRIGSFAQVKLPVDGAILSIAKDQRVHHRMFFWTVISHIAPTALSR